MAIQFRKATKTAALLRMGISGPAGSGKTFTALVTASLLAETDPGKILMIDTQRGQGDHYGNQFDFDIYPLENHHPERFIEVMREAVKAGYKYIIIDSITHEWTGNGGCLEWHDEVARRTKNTFTAWKEVTPVHNKFFDTINSIGAHVIGTLRAKIDHVQDVDDSGKKVVKKMGMGSIQREGSDYEFDVLMEIDTDHVGIITKCRDGQSGAGLDGKAFKKPGAPFVDALRRWMQDGGPRLTENMSDPDAQAKADAYTKERLEILAALQALYESNGATGWDAYAAKAKIQDKDNEGLKSLLATWQKAAIEKAQAADPLASKRDEADELMGKLEAAGLDADSIVKLQKGVIIAEESDDKKLTALIVRLKSALNELAESEVQKAVGF